MGANETADHADAANVSRSKNGSARAPAGARPRFDVRHHDRLLIVLTAILILIAAAGLVLFGIGTAFYLTCHQGPGPRDGLMVGLCQHFHWKIGIVRTSIEVLVCVFGFLLGGVLGIGTLMFAFGIGWVVQYTLFFISRVPYFHHKMDNVI